MTVNGAQNATAVVSTGACLDRSDSVLDQLDDGVGSSYGCKSMPCASLRSATCSSNIESLRDPPQRIRRAASSRHALNSKASTSRTFQTQRTGSASSLGLGMGSQKLERAGSMWSVASDADSFDANEVYPGLWVGGLSAAQDSENLIQRCIWSVVTVASRLKPSIAWLCRESSSIKTTNIEIEDHPLADILGALPEAIKAIDRVMKKRAQGIQDGCLVHCASGISRSVTACVAWLMLRNELSLADALQTVKRRRKDAAPNVGFMQSLKLLDEQKGEAKHRLRQAQSLWKKANNENNRDHAVQKMRKVADKLSERACVLEELLAQQACILGSLHTSMKKQFEKLLADIEAAEPAHCIDDNLASTIRKTAAQKVSRLLNKLRAADCSQSLAYQVIQKQELPESMIASLKDYMGGAPVPSSHRKKFRMFQHGFEDECIVTL
eukprot:TRINITY_DN1775_c0_g9_i1.p1 TRINITY_DN1775_c0_g9~~TRINITY_DN1775_c0_g9_i1.p1  ORF type:complete len:438 (+),score=64.12 TRINITY_DN1775_c0_g9_i1:127-1440(+)